MWLNIQFWTLRRLRNCSANRCAKTFTKQRSGYLQKTCRADRHEISPFCLGQIGKPWAKNDPHDPHRTPNLSKRRVQHERQKSQAANEWSRTQKSSAKLPNLRGKPRPTKASCSMLSMMMAMMMLMIMIMMMTMMHEHSEAADDDDDDYVDVAGDNER